MKQVLILGGRGFLGGHICRKFIERGYKVIIQSTKSGDFDNLKDIKFHPNIEYLTCDYQNNASMKSAFNRSDFLVHSSIPYPLCVFGQSQKRKIEMENLKYVLDLAIESKIKKSIFVSVCGTIGQQQKEIVDETNYAWDWNDTSSLKSKAIAEQMIVDYCKMGLNGIIVNPSMLVGEFDSRPSTGEFFKMVLQLPFGILKNHKLNIIDVSDSAEGIVLAIEKGRVGQRYILASNNTNFQEFTKNVRSIAGKPAIRIYAPDLLVKLICYFSEVHAYLFKKEKPAFPILGYNLITTMQHYNCQKAQDELQFIPKNAWGSVEKAFQWYKKNGFL